MKPLQLLGKRFGQLLVIQTQNAGKNLQWLVLCDCGNIKTVRGADLNSGKTKSCGCKQSIGIIPYAQVQHGLSSSRFYRIWVAMRQRCNNPKASRFAYYGGRGIKVSEQWEVFENFKTDMYESYLSHIKTFGEKDTSLDRKNNNANYSPENCQWATQKEQVNNSRRVLKQQKGE